MSSAPCSHVVSMADAALLPAADEDKLVSLVAVSLAAKSALARALLAPISAPLSLGSRAVARAASALAVARLDVRVGFVVCVTLGAMSLSGLVRTHRSDKSALSVAVRHVLGVRAEKQMVGSDAWWIVASVADLDGIGDLAIVDSPRHAMGALQPAVYTNDAVSVRRSACRSPEPAVVCLLDLFPESFSESSHADNLTHYQRILNG